MCLRKAISVQVLPPPAESPSALADHLHPREHAAPGPSQTPGSLGCLPGPSAHTCPPRGGAPTYRANYLAVPSPRGSTVTTRPGRQLCLQVSGQAQEEGRGGPAAWPEPAKSSSCFPPPQGMPPATLSPSMSTLQLGKLRLRRREQQSSGLCSSLRAPEARVVLPGRTPRPALGLPAPTGTRCWEAKATAHTTWSRSREAAWSQSQAHAQHALTRCGDPQGTCRRG